VERYVDTSPDDMRNVAVWSLAYIERYNRMVRYDWLTHHLFETLDEIQDFATRWLWTGNHDRPNMALGGITPKQKLALVA
jgi:putative transposase